MKMTFKPVQTGEDQRTLARLADEIWHEYWPSLIGAAQTDYMVEQFQSLEAIKRDMAQNSYEYWLIYIESDADAAQCDDDNKTLSENARLVGYTGGHVESETNRFFISKIYLRSLERGRHLSSIIMAFYEDLCTTRGLCAMYLTVNKHNDLAVRAYMRNGFSIIDSVETQIGEGFIMDDFIMQKEVK